MTNLKVFQVGNESATLGSPNTLTYQLGVEAGTLGTPQTRLYQLGVEVATGHEALRDTLTFSDTTSIVPIPHGNDSFVFGDVARTHAANQHATSSDVISFSDRAAGGIGLQPQRGVRIPGVGSHAVRRTRGIVNMPRTFKASRPAPPLQRGGYDSLTFSDAATRSAISTAKSASDAITFLDSAAPGLVARDAIVFSDAASSAISRTRTASDSLTFSDNASRQANFTRASSDALTFSDAATGALGFARTSSDSLSFADSVRFGLSPRDTLTFSDAATRSVMHYTSTGADAFSFADSAVGPTGHNTRTSSDTLHFFDRPVSFTFDRLVFSDSAAAGPVFMAGTDAFSFSDTATASGFVTNVRVYQTYLETLITPSDTRGLVYQMGLETTVKPHSTAHILKAGEEVVVGRIYGQIWPIGWGQVNGRGKGRYGQLWPRWSRDYTGGIGND